MYVYLYNVSSYLPENMVCITTSRCLLFKETVYTKHVNKSYGYKYRDFFQILNMAAHAVITGQAH
jgi:hypothetical protein